LGYFEKMEAQRGVAQWSWRGVTATIARCKAALAGARVSGTSLFGWDWLASDTVGEARFQ
jgi:hypothetical protein